MKYDSPVIKFLESVANMLIVSLCWIVCCIPILTIIPSSAALYHTVNKIIFGEGRGKGVLKNFFTVFKMNFVQGLKIDLIVLACTLIIIIGLNTGLQIYTLSIIGLLYLILGFVITFVFVTGLVYIPAVVSRFMVNIRDCFKLSFYFAAQNPLLSIVNVVLLGLLVLIVEIIPLALVIAPALYADLIRKPLERRMNRFIEENHLQETIFAEEYEAEETEELSAVDLDAKLRSEKRGMN